MGHLQNGDFAYNADTARFVDKMVREHGFEPQQLHDVLAQTKKLDFVIRLMDKQAPSAGRPSVLDVNYLGRYASTTLAAFELFLS